MARKPQRKVYANHDGAKFSVGTIVVAHGGVVSAQRGVILRILPPTRHTSSVYAWVAMDVPTRFRRFSERRTKPHGVIIGHRVETQHGWPHELAEERAREAAGTCVVHEIDLDYLTPVGQARRVPKCATTQRPSILREPAGVDGRWVRRSR